jgi:hypothetical protein
VTAADKPEWDHLQQRALVVGAAGLIVCAAVAFFHPAALARSYLVAYNFWLGIGLGSLAIVMIYHLTGGGWGLVVRRLLESATRTLPLLALLFVPLLLGLHRLYSWTNPEQMVGDAVLEHKAIYLNIPFFFVRAVVYFAVWITLAFFVNRWSRQQDEVSDAGLPRRFQLLSGHGLVLYGLTITFASVDWVMSLEPHWFSTIFAVVFGTGQVLGAFAFAIAALTLLASRPPLRDIVSAAHLQDLGSLLLAFVMVWSYVSFSQFLLIWSGNLPDEISWYLPRFQGGWQWLGVGLVLCQFALPFLLLLSRDIKRNPRALAAIAVFTLVMRFIDLLWEIVPAFPPSDLVGHWLDIAGAVVAAIGVGGVWLAVFLWQLKKLPLVPLHDPVLAEMHHG